MLNISIKLKFFNPVSNQYFDITNDVKVQIVTVRNDNDFYGTDPIDSQFDTANNVFTFQVSNDSFSKNNRIKVLFGKTNFSTSRNKWLGYNEVKTTDLPIFVPATLPFFVTNRVWNDVKKKYEVLFGNSGISRESSASEPFVIYIPLREIFNIGHRGAPYHFPENTIAGFQKAIDLGANALEFDLCLTKDNNVVVFHDSQPVAISLERDRRIVEPYPYELVSPSFESRNKVRFFSWSEFTNGAYKEAGYKTMTSYNQLDIVNLTVAEVKKYYKYAGVNGVIYEIPTLEEFLDFVVLNNEKLRLLFFDIKQPNLKNDETLIALLGRNIGLILKKYPQLPEHLVVCSPKINLLKQLRKSILEAGEMRCKFAYDAAGGVGAVIADKASGFFSGFSNPIKWLANLFTPKIDNPLKVALEMGNKVVSIGSLFRPSSEKEIRDSTYERDYNSSNNVEIVLHWTLNEPKQLIESLNYGVNGIVTDRPDELSRILKLVDVKIV